MTNPAVLLHVRIRGTRWGWCGHRRGIRHRRRWAGQRRVDPWGAGADPRVAGVRPWGPAVPCLAGAGSSGVRPVRRPVACHHPVPSAEAGRPFAAMEYSILLYWPIIARGIKEWNNQQVLWYLWNFVRGDSVPKAQIRHRQKIIVNFGQRIVNTIKEPITFGEYQIDAT